MHEELEPIDVPNIGPVWAAWRAVSKGLAPSIDWIERHWTLEDVLDANEFIDASEDAVALRHYAERVAKERDRGGGDPMSALSDPRVLLDRHKIGEDRPEAPDDEADGEVLESLREQVHDPQLLAQLQAALGLNVKPGPSDDGDEPIE